MHIFNLANYFILLLLFKSASERSLIGCLNIDPLDTSICFSCQKGFYLLLFQCKPCPSGCNECSSSKICTSCNEGYYLSESSCNKCAVQCKICQDNGNKCTKCFDGYFLNNYQCKECDSSCKTCNASAYHCSSCNEKYYLSSNNTCLECHSTCKLCFSIDKCLSCINKYFLYDNKCYECNLNCKTSSDGCKCSSCNEGYYFKNYQCLQCDSKCLTCQSSADNCLSIHQQCYDTCKTCNILGNDEIHNCTECKENFRFKMKKNNYLNCYSTCPFYHYLMKKKIIINVLRVHYVQMNILY